MALKYIQWSDENTEKKTSIFDISCIFRKVENGTDARVSCYTLRDTHLFFCVVSKQEGYFFIVSVFSCFSQAV